MSRDYKVYLEDILEAVTKIGRYTEGMSFETFSEDDKTTDAVVSEIPEKKEAPAAAPPGGGMY